MRGRRSCRPLRRPCRCCRWCPGRWRGSLAARSVSARDVLCLLRPVEKAAERLPGRAVLEVQLDLDDFEAGAQSVDGHPRFHAEARGERQQLSKYAGPHGALAGDGGRHGPPRRPLEGPGGGPDRDAKAPPAPPRKRRDREVGGLRVTCSPRSGHYVALTVADRLDELPELACR